MRALNDARGVTPAIVPRIQNPSSLHTTSGGEASHALAPESTAKSTAYTEREKGGASHMQSFDHGAGEGRVFTGASAAAKTSGRPRSHPYQLRSILPDTACAQGRLMAAGPGIVPFAPVQGASTAWRPLRGGQSAATASSARDLRERFDDARARAEGFLDTAAEASMNACHAAYRATFGALPATLRLLSLLASAMFVVYVLAALAHPHEALAQAGPASGEGAGAGGFDPISTTLANIRDYLIRILVYFGGIAFAITFILMMVALADERAQRGAKLAAKFSFIGLIGGVLVTSIVQIAIGFAPGGGGGAA